MSSLLSSLTTKKEKKVTQSLPIPSVFGKYKILDHLGRGGMGDVYHAQQIELGRSVALKILPIELTNPDSLERFNSEARAISKLEHQNIVTLYDFGTIGYRKYIAMQYIDGITLNDYLKYQKNLDYKLIVHIGKQICRALLYAHSQNVIHRDVKAGNIMIDKHNQVFLSDFGIAYIEGSARLTTTGMAMGTPEYMSPEQCEGKPLDALCDIYGLGIVFYEMVSGKPPFTGENALSIAYKQVHEAPVLLSKIKPDVPSRLELIVNKCLKKAKEQRYQSAAELLESLDSVFTDSSTKEFESLLPQLPEKRITDRRNQDRRFPTDLQDVMSPSKYSLSFWILLIGISISALALAIVWYGTKSPAVWTTPQQLSQIDFNRQLVPRELPWKVPPESSILKFEFKEEVYIQGFEIQYSFKKNNSESGQLFYLYTQGNSEPIPFQPQEGQNRAYIPLTRSLQMATKQFTFKISPSKSHPFQLEIEAVHFNTLDPPKR